MSAARDSGNPRATGHHMAAEIAEIPAVIARQVRDHLDAYLALGRGWADTPPPYLATCARGTSDQAALFFKYLTEIGTGIPVASLGPSLGTVYGARLRMKGATLVAVSQSGASPDLVALTQAAQAGGARTVALLNSIPSPLADVSDTVLPLAAGPERAVAATKSLVASLFALSAVHAGQTGDARLLDALAALPDTLRALEPQAAPDLQPLARHRRLFCLGRGLGLAVSGEAALKLKETCLLSAESASSAEFRHGPQALADGDLAALAFVLDDAAQAGNAELIASLRARGAQVIRFDPAAIGLKGDHPPAVQAIALVTAFYRQVWKLSRALGLDPDAPPHLVKATLTR
ncbi:MAG: SIS domain-containing protein [Rhodobacteraceae bacterium]|nr:SIS domain-containing protein [Paracoccaceae bacterium]